MNRFDHQHAIINRNLGNPTTNPATNEDTYPLDYVSTNTRDEMKDLIERMIAIDVNTEINGDKILCHPIFHLQKIQGSKQKQRGHMHRSGHRHHSHHHRSKSTNTQIKNKPKLNKIKSNPLPTAVPTAAPTLRASATSTRKTNTMKKCVKKHNHDQRTKSKTATKKSSEKNENQATFGNKARKTQTKCYVVKPTLEIIYE